MQSFDFRKRFAFTNFSFFETIRLFKFLPPPPPFNLNVKCIQRIRTILFTRLKIHTNSYFTNFSSRMLVLEKEKKKMYAYHRIDLFRNKVPYEKIFTSTISMWTFPYRFTPFAYTASPPKNTKNKILSSSLSIDKIYSFILLCFSFFFFFFKYPRFWQSPIHIYSCRNNFWEKHLCQGKLLRYRDR